MNITLQNKIELKTITNSARICYGLEPKPQVDPKLLTTLFNAKHLSTFEHVTLNLRITNISRYLSLLLKMHTNYSASELSQRYTEIQAESFYEYEQYKETYDLAIDLYKTLLEQGYKKEIARYVLPLGTYTSLALTINLTTALRYIVMANSSSLPELQEFGKQLKQVLNIPELVDILNVIDTDRVSDISAVLLQTYMNPPKKMILPQFDKVYYKPAKHKDTLNIEKTMFKNLAQKGNFTTKYNMSIAIFLQNQRHRTSSFTIALNKSSTSLYIPKQLTEDVRTRYVSTLLQMHKQESVYLLPNAHNIVVVEQVSYEDFEHKARERLCRTAQTEIRITTMNQVKKLKKLPWVATTYLPPCCELDSSGNKRGCNKGKFYCGVKVWEKVNNIQDLEELYNSN